MYDLQIVAIRDKVAEVDGVIQITGRLRDLQSRRTTQYLSIYLPTYPTWRKAIVTEYKSRMYLLLYDPCGRRSAIRHVNTTIREARRFEREPKVGVRAWAFMRAAANRRIKSQRDKIVHEQVRHFISHTRKFLVLTSSGA